MLECAGEGCGLCMDSRTLAEDEHFVRFLDHLQQVFHRARWAHLAFSLRSNGKTGTASHDNSIESLEFLDPFGDVELLRIRNSIRLDPFAHKVDLNRMSGFQSGDGEPKGVPDMFRSVRLKYDTDFHIS